MKKCLLHEVDISTVPSLQSQPSASFSLWGWDWAKGQRVNCQSFGFSVERQRVGGSVKSVFPEELTG